MRREGVKFSGVMVLPFLAEIFQDAVLGESSPIFRSQNLSFLKKKMLAMALQTAKSFILERFFVSMSIYMLHCKR